MKHEALSSLKENLCLNRSLFAPAVICLQTSARANKHIHSALGFGGTKTGLRMD